MDVIFSGAGVGSFFLEFPTVVYQCYYIILTVAINAYNSGIEPTFRAYRRACFGGV